MKIIFFGTSEFAANILKRISKKCTIIAVVTQPDRRKGRSLKITAPPVKIEAEKSGIHIFQPPDINTAHFVAKIKELRPDLLVVVSFGSMLGKELLGAAKLGALNIHPSLLPKYRGAAPMQRAILAGENKTGVTIINMNERLDAGDIVLQKEIEIEDNDTYDTLSGRLAFLGADLFLESAALLLEGKAEFRKQDERKATMAPKLRKKDGFINWNLPAGEILKKIRALELWPGTYTGLAGKMLKIAKAEEAKGADIGKFRPGEVIAADRKNGLIIRAKDGAISVLEVQMEGKKKMSAELFLRGHSVKVGAKLG